MTELIQLDVDLLNALVLTLRYSEAVSGTSLFERYWPSRNKARFFSSMKSAKHLEISPAIDVPVDELAEVLALGDRNLPSLFLFFLTQPQMKMSLFSRSVIAKWRGQDVAGVSPKSVAGLMQTLGNASCVTVRTVGNSYAVETNRSETNRDTRIFFENRFVSAECTLEKNTENNKGVNSQSSFSFSKANPINTNENKKRTGDSEGKSGVKITIDGIEELPSKKKQRPRQLISSQLYCSGEEIHRFDIPSELLSAFLSSFKALAKSFAVTETGKVELHSLKDRVLYLTSRWNALPENVRSGDFHPPVRFLKTGEIRTSDRLLKAISTWIEANPDWQNQWEDLINAAGSDWWFRKGAGRFSGWKPTLSWMFTDKPGRGTGLARVQARLKSALPSTETETTAPASAGTRYMTSAEAEDLNHLQSTWNSWVSRPDRRSQQSLAVLKEGDRIRQNSWVDIALKWMGEQEDWRGVWEEFLFYCETNAFFKSMPHPNRDPKFQTVKVSLEWLFKYRNGGPIKIRKALEFVSDYRQRYDGFNDVEFVTLPYRSKDSDVPVTLDEMNYVIKTWNCFANRPNRFPVADKRPTEGLLTHESRIYRGTWQWAVLEAIDIEGTADGHEAFREEWNAFLIEAETSDFIKGLDFSQRSGELNVTTLKWLFSMPNTKTLKTGETERAIERYNYQRTFRSNEAGATLPLPRIIAGEYVGKVESLLASSGY